MDGKLNCSMTAENAAFTKIRHLDSRVTDAETRLDVLEQETTQLDEALQDTLTSLGEKVETENVDTVTLNADIVDATHIEADSITTPELTATDISAETINVDNLENVNILHGKTVDVEKTIATIGQFTETQTTTANNSTTNTATLNVGSETNLTGQVNIDGDMTFTKDNGLSKLQGNYLEIDAANVVIDNKDSSKYALLVPGVDGDALFGGSVAVQDTLAAKNLIVTNETHIGNLVLDEAALTNPTFEDIAQTEEVTDKALDIDENGKLVRKFVAGGSAGSVANALIANETRYNYVLLDKYKADDKSTYYQVVLSNTASLTYDVSHTANSYLKNNNGLRYEFENTNNSAGALLDITSLVHNNFFYAIIPTLDGDSNVLSAELRAIKMNDMSLEYSIDVSEYFTGSWINFAASMSWLSSSEGNILSDDRPVLPLVNTNKYVDLVRGTILTRDQNFSSGYTYYLSKSNTWYELKGSSYTDDYWATNNKYSSIEDAALIEGPIWENDEYVFDAPVFCTSHGTLKWSRSGTIWEYKYNNRALVYRDENDNKVFIKPGSLKFNGVEYKTNITNNIGYVVNEYISEIPYYVEKVKIDRTQADFTDVPVTAEVVKTIDAEIDGMKFYKGKWYDKIVGTTKELVDYVLDTANKSNYETYSILYTGNSIDFNASNMPDTEITSAQVVGTYKVYSDSDDDVRELNFVENGYDPFTVGKNIFDKMHFYGFETNFDVASKDNTRCLHLNNCTLYFKDNYGAGTSVGIFKLNKCNNVSIKATDINWSSFPGAEWENCNNVQLRYWGFIQGGTYSSMNIWMVDCNDCYVAVPPVNIRNVSFGQVGKGSNLVVHFESEYGKKIEPTYTTAIQ